MMKRYTLVVLAAGMGSRFGGLKQVYDIDGRGNSILDYSLYDAVDAGFNKIVFIIREDFSITFKKRYKNKFAANIEVHYLYQELDYATNNYDISKRLKPWGTAHAILLSKAVVKEGFLVINADDFYGKKNFEIAFNQLQSEEILNENSAIITFKLKDTLSENGSVSRGVCNTDEDKLIKIQERSGILQVEGTCYYESDGKRTRIDSETLVSMNLWLFSPSILPYFEIGFKKFIKEYHEDLDAEFFIPSVINDLLKREMIQIKVALSLDKWFGITYKEDMLIAQKRIADLNKMNEYPKKLWT